MHELNTAGARFRRWLWAGAIVGGLAAVVLLTSRGDVEEPVSSAPAPTATRPQPPPPPAPALDTERAYKYQVSKLRQRIATLERELEAARLAERPIEEPVVIAPETAKDDGGASGPLSFPEDVPEPYTPRAFARIALDAARMCGMGLDVFAVDCSEFPCIAWTRARDAEVTRFSMDGCTPWKDSFPGATAFAAMGINAEGKQERYFGWMPIPPDKEQLQATFMRGQERAREMKEALGLK